MRFLKFFCLITGNFMFFFATKQYLKTGYKLRAHNIYIKKNIGKCVEYHESIKFNIITYLIFMHPYVFRKKMFVLAKYNCITC